MIGAPVDVHFIPRIIVRSSNWTVINIYGWIAAITPLEVMHRTVVEILIYAILLAVL